MGTRIRYRSVFISDLHLGASQCRARDVAEFLRGIECETLYLVGDIIDMWRLRQRWYWPEDHNRVVNRVLKLAKHNTRVVYIPGNHDEAARAYIGLTFGGVELANLASHTLLDGRRLLVTHGDQYDLVIRHAKLVAWLGSWGYDTLLAVNRHYNRLRALVGLPYWSLAQFLKLRVKKACTFISRFEDALLAEAAAKGFDGVVCGHIHKAEHRTEKIATGKLLMYLNCGDWVEGGTALVEHLDGRLEIIDGVKHAADLREIQVEDDIWSDDAVGEEEELLAVCGV
jgi:UDP-2,3-diacylglucosamine pyrophosphatase LpxH